MESDSKHRVRARDSRFSISFLVCLICSAVQSGSTKTVGSPSQPHRAAPPATARRARHTATWLTHRLDLYAHIILQHGRWSHQCARAVLRQVRGRGADAVARRAARCNGTPMGSHHLDHCAPFSTPPHPHDARLAPFSPLFSSFPFFPLLRSIASPFSCGYRNLFNQVQQHLVANGQGRLGDIQGEDTWQARS